MLRGSGFTGEGVVSCLYSGSTTRSTLGDLDSNICLLRVVPSRNNSLLPRVPLSHSKWEKVRTTSSGSAVVQESKQWTLATALCYQVQPEDRGEKHLDEKRPGKLHSAILAAVIIIITIIIIIITVTV